MARKYGERYQLRNRLLCAKAHVFRNDRTKPQVFIPEHRLVIALSTAPESQ